MAIANARLPREWAFISAVFTLDSHVARTRLDAAIASLGALPPGSPVANDAVHRARMVVAAFLLERPGLARAREPAVKRSGEVSTPRPRSAAAPRL